MQISMTVLGKPVYRKSNKFCFMKNLTRQDKGEHCHKVWGYFLKIFHHLCKKTFFSEFCYSSMSYFYIFGLPMLARKIQGGICPNAILQHQHINILQGKSTQPLLLNVYGDDISVAEGSFSFKNNKISRNSFMYAHNEIDNDVSSYLRVTEDFMMVHFFLVQKKRTKTH